MQNLGAYGIFLTIMVGLIAGGLFIEPDQAPKHSVTTPVHLWRSAPRYTRFRSKWFAGVPAGPEARLRPGLTRELQCRTSIGT